MYRVALIQNQSEMTHYGYADARPLLSQIRDYECTLYTSTNIDELLTYQSLSRYDAVIIASNALNDKEISIAFESEAFKESFKLFLERGGGCFIGHQLRWAAKNDPSLLFLPAPFSEVKATARHSSESSRDGRLELAEAGKDSLLMLYPSRIDINQVNHDAINFKSLPGLYWHYWTEISPASWDVLVVDNSFSESSRGLLFVSKEASPARIVISALTFDWQKQDSIFRNIISYIVEGGRATAILRDERRSDVAFSYLMQSLQSQKFPMASYLNDSHSLKALEDALDFGVHSNLVLGNGVETHDLNEQLREKVFKLVSVGKLRLFGFQEQKKGLTRFYISGREKSAESLLYEAELIIQGELNSGYIDGSFWSTVETLQVLKRINESPFNIEIFWEQLIFKVNSHDRNGSYDEVFGATCALAWLRGTYLGIHNLETQRTLAWIRNRIPNCDSREKALAYSTIVEIKGQSEEEIKASIQLLSSLSIGNLSEIDLTVYLNLSVLLSRTGKLIATEQLVLALIKKQDQETGYWIDLETTASIIVGLVNALEIIKKSGIASYQKQLEDIQNSIFKASLYLQDVKRSQIHESDSYPWGSKLTTTIRCIEASLRVDELMDFPILEVVETLNKFSNRSREIRNVVTSLKVLDDIKRSNLSLASRNEVFEKKIEKQEKEMKTLLSYKPYLIASTALGVYSALTLSWAIFSGGEQYISKAKVLDRMSSIWALHFTLLGGIGFVFSPWQNKSEKKSKSGEGK